MIDVKCVTLEHAKDFELPKYATYGSTGMDLLAAIYDDIILKAGQFHLIPTGFCITLPEFYEAQIRPRSGLALKHGITVLNAPGTIDSDYRGEIKVLLINHSQSEFFIRRGMRIAQMVISKFEKVNLIDTVSLDTTDRGQGGFGSTGKF